MRAFLSFLLFALVACPSYAQTAAPTPDTATVYLYRLRDSYASLLKPSIFSDKVQLVRMRNGRFAKLQLAAGDHTITSTFTGNGLALTLKPGETYYLRLAMTHATLLHNARGEVTQVEPDQGKYEVSQLKEAEPDDLKIDQPETATK